MRRSPGVAVALALGLIRLYQKTLSPDYGLWRRPGCIYRPTCSQYSYEAIEKYGIIKGTVWGVKRISRCHPWAAGGDDPIK